VHRRHVWLTLLLLAAPVLGCGGPFPQTTLAPKSDFGWAIQDLFTTVFWWAVAVFVIVEGLLLYTVLRYRQRPQAAPPPHHHGHTALEIAWTLAPAVILVFIAIPTTQTIFRTSGRAAPGALRVEVIGHQWWWEFRYPDLGIVTANELRLPVGRPVALEMTSADVIHSFWVPGLGGKRDVTQRRTTRLAFTPDSTGVYSGQCAEFCGVSHANMRLRALVDSGPAFDAWVARQRGGVEAAARGSLEERGLQVYRRSPCVACHALEGVSAALIGPDLSHVGGRTTIASGLLPNTAENLTRWIRDAPSVKPGALMPPMPLSDDDLTAVVAFLRSLQ
jgi:cytochrome c oxidase subunit 2